MIDPGVLIPVIGIGVVWLILCIGYQRMMKVSAERECRELEAFREALPFYAYHQLQVTVRKDV
jgi:hypothetical protein